MIAAVLTSAIAYISTNVDDLFVIMILMAQTPGMEKRKLIAGHFLGVGLITAISMLSALGLQNLPMKYIGFLGLLPIALGIKAWFHRDDDTMDTRAVGLLSMAMITTGNGADNIGVYIPLFTGFSDAERIDAIVIFMVMTALWVFLAKSLAEFPNIKTVIENYKDIIIPAVFISLGIFIILDSGLLG